MFSRPRHVKDFRDEIPDSRPNAALAIVLQKENNKLRVSQGGMPSAE
jgi:hypothetical protein